MNWKRKVTKIWIIIDIIGIIANLILYYLYREWFFVIPILLFVVAIIAFILSISKEKVSKEKVI